MEIGDLILVASDGLFDNLYEDFIVQIINNNLVSSISKRNLFKLLIKDDQYSVESLQNLCQMLVESACDGKVYFK